ncbi:hypothetical protein NC652_040930 [Populus alba x Populus x berolinensis]|nr:hypothetical protein NC652_040930 [Populus alba x Populus x berolinensis]
MAADIKTMEAEDNYELELQRIQVSNDSQTSNMNYPLQSVIFKEDNHNRSLRWRNSARLVSLVV